MKRFVFSFFVLCCMACMLFAAGNSSSSAGTGGAATKVTVTSTGFDPNVIDPNSPVYKALERACNVTLDFELIPDKSYLEKFSALVASNSLTDVMYIDDLLNNAFTSGRRGNAFWKLNDHVSKLPNISKVDPSLLKRASLEGEIYGLSRDRQIGRLALTYRKDWADKLGLGTPKVIEDLYEMAKAFTERDPDGNGVKDTFGLSEHRSMGQGSFATFACWYGAGAGGGPARQFMLDKDNKVIPVFATEEFIQAARFSARLFKDGYMNQDFISVTNRTDNIRNSKAGIYINAVDGSPSHLVDLQKLVPTAEFEFVSMLDAGKGLRAPAENAGYKGYYIFARTTLRNEDALMKALMFFDALNTVEVNNLLEYGIEGLHYNVRNGVATFTPEQIELGRKDRHDLSQLRTFNLVINPCIQRERNPVQIRADSAIEVNNRHFVVGVENGLYSETFARNGAALQNDFDAAHAQFVMGQLDEGGLRAAVTKWYSSGGDRICAASRLGEPAATVQPVNKKATITTGIADKIQFLTCFFMDIFLSDIKYSLLHHDSSP